LRFLCQDQDPVSFILTERLKLTTVIARRYISIRFERIRDDSVEEIEFGIIDAAAIFCMSKRVVHVSMHAKALDRNTKLTDSSPEIGMKGVIANQLDCISRRIVSRGY
jgi:hypothetical protein